MKIWKPVEADRELKLATQYEYRVRGNGTYLFNTYKCYFNKEVGKNGLEKAFNVLVNEGSKDIGS